MAVDEFERYVQLIAPEERHQLLQVALIPAFRTALVSCIRALELQQLQHNPHDEKDEQNLLKAYKALYDERGLYQDFLNGIEMLRKEAIEDGILSESPASPDIRSVEDVVPVEITG